jgi:hypothetical protein
VETVERMFINVINAGRIYLTAVSELLEKML